MEAQRHLIARPPTFQRPYQLKTAEEKKIKAIYGLGHQLNMNMEEFGQNYIQSQIKRIDVTLLYLKYLFIIFFGHKCRFVQNKYISFLKKYGFEIYDLIPNMNK